MPRFIAARHVDTNSLSSVHTILIIRLAPRLLFVNIRRMKLMRFLISGGSAAVVNLSVLYVLTDWFGLWYLASATVSFFVSILIGFMLQKFWTFNHRQSHHRTHKQFLLYLAWMLLYLSLDIGLMYLLVDGASLNYLLSQFVTSGVLAALSFFVYSRVVFISKLTGLEFELEKTINSYTI